mmetsp:Transcript_6468/g.9989  ORF Transcript_6468/g.9989 Transcript_6468/m.9989 type:complete len:96 (+) Transcript_6468:1-288(+)
MQIGGDEVVQLSIDEKQIFIQTATQHLGLQTKLTLEQQEQLLAQFSGRSSLLKVREQPSNLMQASSSSSQESQAVKQESRGIKRSRQSTTTTKTY